MLAGSAACGFDVVVRRGGLANTFARLNGGGSARIAYIGGSVTEAENGWRTNITNWFSAHYPGRIAEINAGWSGTGSAIGALRFQRDVLAHDPNLIFVEFAINDNTYDPLLFTMRNYDGMVRQAWQYDPNIDLVFIETIAWYIEQPYLEGRLPTTVDAHYRIADHYAVPSVNVGWALYQQVLAGTPWQDLAPDRAHPNERGHRIYSDAIVSLLEPERIAGNPPAQHLLPAPATDFPVLGSKTVALGDIALPAGWSRGTGLVETSYAESAMEGAEIALGFSGPVGALTFVMNPDGGTVGYSVDGEAFVSTSLSRGWTQVWAVPTGSSLSTGTHGIRLRVMGGGGVVRLIRFESAIQPMPSPTPTSTATRTPSPTATSTATRTPSATPTYTAGPDADGDAIPDALEGWPPAAGQTNRFLPDSDGDGVLDGGEDTNRNGARDADETDPRAADTDGDGAGDGIEVHILGTDPRNIGSPGPLADDDGDGLPKIIDPNDTVPDRDGDRFLDGYEAAQLGLDAASNPGTSPPLGDASGDGAVSNLDALVVQSLFLGATPPGAAVTANADLNADGNVSNLDALLAQSFFLATTPALPLRGAR